MKTSKTKCIDWKHQKNSKEALLGSPWEPCFGREQVQVYRPRRGPIHETHRLSSLAHKIGSPIHESTTCGPDALESRLPIDSAPSELKKRTQ